MPRLSRRRFLQSSAAAIAAPAFLSAREPGAKLNLAVIGCGGRGAANLQRDARREHRRPVRRQRAEPAPGRREARRRPGKFRDFRKLYDELKDSEFDAVVVSSTEHTHAFATLPALQRKKHVYCEKPLTHNVREARLITRGGRRRRSVATQMGTQIHASEQLPPRRRD